MAKSDDAAVLIRTAQVVRKTFALRPDLPIGRATQAVDIDGWDSISHAVLIMALEDEFNIELPLEHTIEAQYIGELVDIISTEFSV